MKSRKIVSKLSDLPPEFSLDKYLAAEDFQIQDWLVNLEFRTLRLHTVQHLADEFARGVDYLFAQPLLPENVRRAYWTSAGMSKTVLGRQVQDQSVFDALAGHYYFDPEETRFTKYTEAFEQYNDPTEELARKAQGVVSIPMWKAHDAAGIDDIGDVFVRVNLHASEEQLTADFANWLTTTKRERLIDLPRRRITPGDLKEWARFRVLAYLDLTMWARATGCEITHQAIGLALFPKEFEVVLSDRVRKVIAPLARRISTFEFCTFLRAQATAELESKHPDWIPALWESDPTPDSPGDLISPVR